VSVNRSFNISASTAGRKCDCGSEKEKGVIIYTSGVPRGFGGSTPPPKFWRPSKIVPNSTRLWKL